MPRPPNFEITDSPNGSGVTVRVEGELDMDTAQTLSEHLDQCLASDAGDLTLDLREISFMDSSGLRCLIELNDRCREHSRRLRMIPPEHEAAVQVLRATGADTALPFEPGGEA